MTILLKIFKLKGMRQKKEIIICSFFIYVLNFRLGFELSLGLVLVQGFEFELNLDQNWKKVDKNFQYNSLFVI